MCYKSPRFSTSRTPAQPTRRHISPHNSCDPSPARTATAAAAAGLSCVSLFPNANGNWKTGQLSFQKITFPSTQSSSAINTDSRETIGTERSGDNLITIRNIHENCAHVRSSAQTGITDPGHRINERTNGTPLDAMRHRQMLCVRQVELE